MSNIRTMTDSHGWYEHWLESLVVADAVALTDTSDAVPAVRVLLRGDRRGDIEELANAITDGLGVGPVIDTRVKGGHYNMKEERQRYWLRRPSGIMVALEEHGDDFVEFRFWSRPGQHEFAIVEAARAAIRTDDSARVRVLTSEHGELDTSGLDLPDVPMIWENYPPAVVRHGQRLVETFAAGERGSLVILDGPPGTGKTYFIRGLIEAIDAVWIFIPPTLVSRLGSPEFLPAVLAISKRHKSKPIILIVEDADECLVTRASDNISEISAVLNLTDGILGRALNLRLVATTNAVRTEIDHALQRAGRLAAHIEFPALDVQQAFAIASRLLGPDSRLVRFATQTPTLADVYATVAR